MLKPYLCCGLLSLITLGIPARAQDSRHPSFPQSPVFSQPGEAPSLEPAPLEQFLAPRIPMQPGEIMLEGVVQAVSETRQEVELLVTSFTLPNGKQSTLDAPRLKTISFDSKQMIAAAPYPSDGTLPHWISSRNIWPTYRLAVIGLDTGTGNPMTASFIELGAKGLVAGLASAPKPPVTIFFNGVPEHVAATGLRVGDLFGIGTIGGKAARGSSTSDHPRGLALDFMVGRDAKLGDTVAAYFEASAGLENVRYIIWKDHLVYPGARTDWAKLPVDYGPKMTLRHMDHVHVSFLEKPTLPGPYLTDELLSKVKLTPAKLGARSGRRR
jgi:hypothetical protein